jgi:anti-sigma factor RsiW
MSCRLALDDAAYLLGALTASERRAYEEHLPGCPECTRAVNEVAGLPGLLSKVPPGELDVALPEVPATLLPALLSSIRRTRRRRAWTLAALGAVAACLAVVAVVGVVPVHRELPTSETVAAPLQPVGTVPIQASARLAPLPWGTGIELHCSYAAGYQTGAQTYDLVAVDHGGAVQQVATWQVAPGGEAQVTGTSSWQPDDIAALEIRTPAGTAVMRLQT